MTKPRAQSRAHSYRDAMVTQLCTVATDSEASLRTPKGLGGHSAARAVANLVHLRCSAGPWMGEIRGSGVPKQSSRSVPNDDCLTTLDIRRLRERKAAATNRRCLIIKTKSTASLLDPRAQILKSANPSQYPDGGSGQRLP